MSKKIQEEEVELRENEQVTYSEKVRTPYFFSMKEKGTMFITNQRLFNMKPFSRALPSWIKKWENEEAYSIELSEISDVTKGRYFSWWEGTILPHDCVLLNTSSGDLMKRITSGFWGRNSNNLVNEIKKTLDNYKSKIDGKDTEVKKDSEDTETKLLKLNELKEKNLINDDEYNTKKEEIIKKM
jgi:hypothetical protein